jgi:threonyl-tRNA synthetase
VQVDFYQPDRFGLEYTGPDGQRHRPVMVHRSIVGTMERAIAHLIDVHGGAFPPWLAPVQLAVLPITDAELPAADRLVRQAIDVGLRAEAAAPADGSLGARVRNHRLVPYQAVIGSAEARVGDVSLRLRDGRQVPPMPAGEALDRLARAVAAKGTALWLESNVAD